MPFIDIFSLLCTFLLFTAVFVSINTHTVQIPFLTNIKESETESSKDPINIKVNLSREKINLFVENVDNESLNRDDIFIHSKEGITQLNNKLKKLKDKFPSVNKVNLYIDDSILYKDIIRTLDSIKYSLGDKRENLFSQIVFASVIH